MPLVRFLLRSGPLGAHFLALFMRRVRELVFHAPPEAVEALWRLVRRARGQIVRDVMVVLFVIAVGRDDVVVRWDAVEASDLGAFFR
jgi:hypothetical protein